MRLRSLLAVMLTVACQSAPADRPDGSLSTPTDTGSPAESLPRCPEPTGTPVSCDAPLDGTADLEAFRGCTDIDGWVELTAGADLSPLADLLSITALEVHGDMDLGALGNLRTVGYLELNGADADLDSLTCLDDVGFLEITELQRADLAPLGGAQVGGLSLEHTALQALQGITAADTLSALRLTDNPSLNDLSTLGTASEIWELELTGPGPEHLEGLSGVRSLGEIRITDADGLSLDGLGGVTDLEELQVLESQEVDLGGLTGLRTVSGDVVFDGNGAGVSLAGLEGLEVVEGRLAVSRNDALSAVTHLASLQRVGDHVSITDNASLTEVGGFLALTEAARWHITQNPALTSFGGLPALAEVELIELVDNPSLQTVPELEVTLVTERLTFEGSDALQQLTLPALATLGELHVQNNRGLEQIELPALQAAALVSVHDNDALVTLSLPALADAASGLGDVDTSTTGGADGPLLVVSGHPVLTTISAPSLRDPASLELHENVAYLLDGLQGLTAVGLLTVTGHDALVDLSGLDAVEQVGVLDLHDNPSLCASTIEAWVAGRSVDSDLSESNADEC